MQLADLQAQIQAIYGVRDRTRGRDGTFRRFVEEVGELARAIRDQREPALVEEFSDVLAWTVSLASLCGVDITVAASRYARGCPRCGTAPCVCAPEPR